MRGKCKVCFWAAVSLLMALWLLPVCVRADTEGTCGNLTWELDEAGTMRISGNGPLMDERGMLGGGWFIITRT